MEKIEITLGISTIFGRYDNALAVANGARNLFDNVVVVVQGAESNCEESEGNLSIIFSDTLGLSKSRNLLLKHGKSDWLWINDDDVSFKPGHVEVVRNNIRLHGQRAKLFAGRIGCSDCTGLYKKYRFRWMTPLLFAQVSSIEMIVNRNWCLEKSIGFDHRFGLGTDLPTSEEPIFASDIIRSGGLIRDIGEVIVDHPCRSPRLTTRQSWNSEKLAMARGSVAARIGTWRGAAFLLFGFVRSITNGSLNNAMIMFRAYVKYDK
ncbi:glycosyltransferase [Cupriavidus basilensis]|uniref:glycosyltransferase n=1 Tax=Cupriavidus basilensis TaxID=68895 RepID=UPI00345B2C9D